MPVIAKITEAQPSCQSGLSERSFCCADDLDVVPIVIFSRLHGQAEQNGRYSQRVEIV
jgi:hypothetical protein